MQTTSCHHGHSRYPNNLAHAIRVMNTQEEVGVMEIDFVQVGDDFVSSHDYKTENIEQGSCLGDWVEEVIVKRDLILWIDIKSHIDVMGFLFVCCDKRFKFDCHALFKALARLYNKHQSQLRLQDKIWLSCQDADVRDSLIRLNGSLKARYKWTIVTDIPFIYSYVCKYLNDWLPVFAYTSMYDYVFSHFLEFDFTDVAIGFGGIIVCIDQSFFPSDARLIEFIEKSTIPPGATLVLYNYERTHPPIKVMGYTVKMQYEYTTAQRRRRVASPVPVATNKTHSL